MSSQNEHPTPQATRITPNYAPASLDLPWYRDRGFRRLAVIAIVLTVALCIAYVYRDAPHYLKIRSLENKCLAYTAPPDEIVCSELPTDIAKLPASSQEYWLDLSAKPHIVMHRPNCWVAFDSATSGSSGAYAVLFLGERSNSGQRRLVCVLFRGWEKKIFAQANPNLYIIGEPCYVLCSYGIATPNGLPQSFWTADSGGATTTPPDPIRNLRFFAGQPDRNDPSRFTIAYEANGKSGLIEGRLQADTSISLRIKNGPLITPGGLPVGRVLP